MREFLAITKALGDETRIRALLALRDGELCFKYHFAQARKLGATKKDIAQAVAMAESVKAAPAKAIRELAAKYTGGAGTAEEAGAPPESTCCATKTMNDGPSCCSK